MTFKVGDKVKVVKEVLFEAGWNNHWTTHMGEAIGRGSYRVRAVDSSLGVELDRCFYWFPPSSLAKVIEFPVNRTSLVPEHYNLPIQPLDFIEQNKLGFHEGNIVKYVSRYKLKGGVKDLEKALDYLQRLIKIEDDKLPF